MAQLWGEGGLKFACMLAFLWLLPLSCSAWSGDGDFVENQGNSTFLCKSSGPCISCSNSEKEADKYQCQRTGFHQLHKCLEVKTAQEVTKEDDVEHLTGDGKEEGVGSHDRRRLQSTDGKGGRKMLETPVFKLEGGLKVFYTYKTCTPVELKVDRVSVLQFEGLVIASFALCSPLVYYRRKHSFTGMQRIPSMSRF